MEKKKHLPPHISLARFIHHHRRGQKEYLSSPEALRISNDSSKYKPRE
jgi:hypothetical protein